MIAEKKCLIAKAEEVVKKYDSLSEIRTKISNENKKIRGEAERLSIEIKNQTKNCEAHVQKEKEVLQINDDLKTTVIQKEDIIDNLQKALNEQITEFEVQTEQNAILKQEYQNNREELKKSLGENTRLKIDFQS